MKLEITTHFHCKNIVKTAFVVVPVFMGLSLFFTYLEIPPMIAAIIGIAVGIGMAEYCSNRWELWHFEHKYVEDKNEKHKL